MSRRALIASGVLATALAAGVVAGATQAGPSPQSTVRIRVVAHGGQPNGPSSDPRLSGDGRFVAFASQATNLAGKPARHVSDVYLYSQEGGVRLISSGPGGAPANGPSVTPVVASAGNEVAFASRAANLVPGTSDKHSDVFAWSPGGAIRLVSASPKAAAGDGDSDQPAVSADGRLIAFSSQATNLVAGDTNQHRDVFVRDTMKGDTIAVSLGVNGAQSNGDSSAPAISPDGRYVSFYSTATNLVAMHTSGKGDVYLRDLVSKTTRLVSLSGGSKGHEQNAAVPAPFAQVSAVSAAGRLVVFDSDATNLVPHDRNRHTDVFVRDMAAGTVRRASLATTDQEANSDSFAPSITADGRFVTFESFAQNLVPYEPVGPNIFVRDLRRRTTVMAEVSSQGRPRGPEHVKDLLQSPSISDDGGTVAFESTATNLVAGDTNGVRDVFLHRLNPAPITILSHKVGVSQGHLVLRFLSASASAAPLLCRIDRAPKALCPLGRTVLPRLGEGRHVVVAYPGGIGTAYALRPIVVQISMRHGRARVKTSNPGSQLGLGG